MTEETYNGLSDEAKAAIDANSTCDTSKELGAFVDNWNFKAMEMLKNTEGHTFGEMTPEEVQGLIFPLLEELMEKSWRKGKRVAIAGAWLGSSVHRRRQPKHQSRKCHKKCQLHHIRRNKRQNTLHHFAQRLIRLKALEHK